ncbi:hypothetical protein OJ998_15510 [Solirubrobacter taibaiensis]|nr:hypothetical protein [Solirubrobacter taibaiensis]
MSNHALARLLARQPVAELPKLADTLRHYRAGAPLLKALAPAPAGTDLAAATAWLRSLAEVLRVLGDAADASALTFESTVVTDRDAEYGAAGADVHEKIGAARWGAQALGERMRDHVVSAMNASSVVGHGRADNPALGSLDQAKAFSAQASAFRAAAPTPELKQAAEACQDAALALLQARSVAEARETWRADTVQTNTVDEVKDSRRARNEMDDVFADSGFNDRQQTKKIKVMVKQEDGTFKEVEKEVVDDWCGMFAAANMFRGAALDKDLRMAFAHTDNVNDFFQYTAKVNAGRAPLSVWADGRWWSVREYHASRSALRKWVVGPSAAADIRPGDIALIRHKGVKPKDGIANHIVMVESYDATTGKLVSIEGNVTEGVRPDGDGKAQRTGDELKSSSKSPTSTVVEVRDMKDEQELTPGAGPGGVYQERGRRTVYAIGRPSLVDFEDHEYAEQLVDERFRGLSPAEIRAHAQAKKQVKLARSSMESPANSPYHTRTGG